MLVTSRATAGKLILAPVGAGPAGEPEFSLMTMKATRMATTATRLPPAMNSLFRRSARRAAATCAAIRSRALPCLFRAAFLIWLAQLPVGAAAFSGRPLSLLAGSRWRRYT
jgi:hypothetical protein